MVRAGIPGIKTVTPLQGGSHLITVNDPTHWTASTRGIHILRLEERALVQSSPRHSSTEDGE